VAEELGGQQSYPEMGARFGYLTLREGKVTEAHHIFAETAQNCQRDGSEIGVVFLFSKLAFS
jgi:hypothetical protein